MGKESSLKEHCADVCFFAVGSRRVEKGANLEQFQKRAQVWLSDHFERMFRTDSLAEFILDF